MKINANTKIASLLKYNPEALDAIISISETFNKLKNPILRKLMASRTSISMASKAGGCTVNDFFSKLEPLGFIIDTETAAIDDQEQKTVPGFLRHITAENLPELDVRSIINAGNDPFNLIKKTVTQMKAGQVLKLVNSFEPAPLITLLGKQGFQSYVERKSEDLVHTFFYKIQETAFGEKADLNERKGWEELIQRFIGRTTCVDVRQLEMPLPMHTILEALDKLDDGNALYVIHKRIPVFLLPELAERNFDYRVKEVSDAEVLLLIFKH